MYLTRGAVRAPYSYKNLLRLNRNILEPKYQREKCRVKVIKVGHKYPLVDLRRTRQGYHRNVTAVKNRSNLTPLLFSISESVRRFKRVQGRKMFPFDPGGRKNTKPGTQTSGKRGREMISFGTESFHSRMDSKWPGRVIASIISMQILARYVSSTSSRVRDGRRDQNIPKKEWQKNRGIFREGNPDFFPLSFFFLFLITVLFEGVGLNSWPLFPKVRPWDNAGLWPGYSVL